MSYFSAGIGRTGTFIAIDYLLRQAKAESYIINLVLRSMRKRITSGPSNVLFQCGNR